MPRYRVTLEYDGTPFVGWQVQALGVSVQGRLTEAIGKLSGETVSLRGAGRTDAGVHALGQVAHFDLGRAWPVDTVRAAVNFHLKPDPIAILDCAVVADDFDARFSATARHYRYRILARPAPPVLDRDRVWWVPQPMHAGGDAGRCRGRWSAGTTSRRFAPPAARPSRRSRRSTAWRSRPAARKSTSPRRRARSCTTRCARWWAR